MAGNSRIWILAALAIALSIIVLLWADKSANESPLDNPLFSIEASEEAFEETVLEGFLGWAHNNPKALGLPAGSTPQIENLSVGPPTFRNELISIVRFKQTYRGLPVHGDSRVLSLTVFDQTDIVTVSGTLVDEGVTFEGLGSELPVAQAQQFMLMHWGEQVGPGLVTIDGIRRVALADEQIMAFVGDAHRPLFTASREFLGSVIVNAETGALIGIENLPAESDVRGLERSADPLTETIDLFEGLPTDQIGNTIHFEAHPVLDCAPPSWVDIRMGDATRHIPLSFDGGGGETASHFSAGRCSSGSPEEQFLGGIVGADSTIGITLYAQDLFVKTQAAMDVIDPLMGELFTHGTTHPYSWDHHPKVPDIAHQAPMITVVNASSEWSLSQPGVMKHALIEEDDTAALNVPVPHPSVFFCQDAGEVVDCGAPGAGSPTQAIALIGVSASFPFHTRTLMHELGHYYDYYNSHGISGGNGEIVAQLFSLYLHHKLYPSLDYTLPTLSMDGECRLGLLVGHSAGQVMHPDCIDEISDIVQFSPFADGEYSVPAFTQAFWSLLFGVNCSPNGSTVSCSAPNNSAGYSARWMEALLFALQIGNDQEPIEVWDNMAVFIAANYPADNNLLASVRALHGLD